MSACARVVECSALPAKLEASCVACLEHIDPDVLAKLKDEYGPIPALDEVTCDVVNLVVNVGTNIGQCATEGWYVR